MINIPRNDKKRVVIVGCGFAGLTLSRKLKNSGYQVVVIDKHNYHQFPPLFYQVASAGLEESAVLFPLRKIFQHYDDFYIRKAEVSEIDSVNNQLITSMGTLEYDSLVLAFGATNSFFGSTEMQQYSKGMKTIAEVLDLRNSLLLNFENALTSNDKEEQEMFLNIVIIGGGPSGVEISGALAEMNKYIIPKDYPELKELRAKIYLIEAADRLLSMMSEKSSAKSQEFLEKAGVTVMTKTKVTGCDKKSVFISSGEAISTTLKEFKYKDLGTMATVGRNLAVVELPFIHFHGVFAWYVWMFIHLMGIIGVKNKLMIFFNWAWKYLTYDQSTRIILRPKDRP